MDGAAFSLGELSGSVKQMLSLAKSSDFVYELKSTFLPFFLLPSFFFSLFCASLRSFSFSPPPPNSLVCVCARVCRVCACAASGSLVTESDGTRVYTLKMIYQDDDVFDQFTRVFDFYQVQSASATVELNQSAGQQSADYLQARIKIEGEITRAAVKMLQLFAPRATPQGTFLFFSFIYSYYIYFLILILSIYFFFFLFINFN
jgi:hypothetical protein